MKNTLFLSFLLLLTCLACNEAGTLLVSDSQKAGVLKVSEFFGSTVTYKWTHLYGSDGNETTFKLTIDSLNEGIAVFKEHPFILASNAAVLFFRQLSEQEKAELQNVEIVLPFKTDDADMYTYRRGLVDTMASKMPLIDTLMHHIVHQNYDAILVMCPWIDKAGKKALQDGVQETIAKWGAMTGYTSLGFQFMTSESRPLFCRYYALIEAEKQRIQFSIDFDPNLASQDLIAFQMNHLFR